jgi:hypothetical protein
MKKKIVAVLSTMALSLGGVWLASPAHAGDLDLLGAKLSWDDQAFYAPSGCSRFTLRYENGLPGTLRSLGFTITSRFGDAVAEENEFGIGSGLSGTFSPQICGFQLTDGLGPYTVTFKISDYAGSSRETTAPLTFLARPGSTQPAAEPSPSVSDNQNKFVRCIKKSNFKQKRYKGKWAKQDKCPEGWIKITI